MEGKYERAVDKSLTYHFIADRLDGYILEERFLLRELEDKVHCTRTHTHTLERERDAYAPAHTHACIHTYTSCSMSNIYIHI